MEQIKALLNLKKSTTSISERSELLKEFLEEINRERIGTQFKQMKPAQLAVKLAHIPTKDLYYLRDQGYDYQKRKGSFGRYVFGVIKPRH